MSEAGQADRDVRGAAADVFLGRAGWRVDDVDEGFPDDGDGGLHGLGLRFGDSVRMRLDGSRRGITELLAGPGVCSDVSAGPVMSFRPRDQTGVPGVHPQ